MAKKDKDTATKDKAANNDKKDKKAKKGKDAAAGASIANHPRAKASILRAKAWAGLAGFAIAALLSLQASVPMFQAGLRALGAGVVGYMLAWWIGVMLWRQLILAEQRAVHAKIEARRSAEAEEGADSPRAQARSTA